MCISVTITSPHTSAYNCFAWAAGRSRTNEWWNPLDIENDYWPDGVPRGETVEAYILAYGKVGYHQIEPDDSDLETGFEKIAIYASTTGKPLHAARQLPDGQWTSKIGVYQDVRHEFIKNFTVIIKGENEPYGSMLESVDYGKVVVMMKRKPED